MLRRSLSILLIAVGVVYAVVNPALQNGGFETTDFTGWTVSAEPGGAASVETSAFGTTSALAVLTGNVEIRQAFTAHEGKVIALDISQESAADDTSNIPIPEVNDDFRVSFRIWDGDPDAGATELARAGYIDTRTFDLSQGPLDPNQPVIPGINPPGATVVVSTVLFVEDFVLGTNSRVTPFAQIGDSVGPISIETGAFESNPGFAFAADGRRIAFRASRDHFPWLTDSFVLEVRVENADFDNLLRRAVFIDDVIVANPPRITLSLRLPETGEPIPCDSTFDWARDKPMQFTVLTSDEGPRPPFLGNNQRPVGASFSRLLFTPPELAGGRFTWTPVAGDEGQHVIEFTAVNAVATTTCTLTVNVRIDRDGDSLPDVWELDGYTPPGGGFVDLPALGADVRQKDLFVYVDYFQNAEYDHRPPDLTRIIEAFQNAPGGAITLHVFVSPEPAALRPTPGPAVPFVLQLGTGTSTGNYRWTRPDGDASATLFFDDIKNGDAARGIATHFPPGLQCSTRYGLFAHRIADLRESGIARGIPSSDFIVSLGEFIDDSEPTPRTAPVALALGTFMHELGHGIGLRHGGGDETNFKPNYLSVMNYSFQRGVRRDGGIVFDFSHAALPGLEETALDEDAGVQNWPDSAAGYETTWFRGFGDGAEQQWTPPFEIGAAVGVDWNQDGTTDGTIGASINRDFSRTLLAGFNDWANIDFSGGTVGGGVMAPLPEETTTGELDVETALQIRPGPVQGLAARSGRGSVRLNWNPGGLRGDVTYKVFRKLQGAADFTEIGTSTSTLFSDRGVMRRRTYVYTVTMIDGLGVESLASAEVTVRVR